MSSWTRVPQEVARLHPLYGVKGWVILPAIGLATMPIKWLVALLTAPDAEEVIAHLPWLSLGIHLEDMVLLAFSISAVILLGGLINHREWFRPGYTVYGVTGVALSLIEMIFMSSVARDHGVQLQMSDIVRPRDVVRLIAMILWVVYVNTSVRIRVTCESRVPYGYEPPPRRDDSSVDSLGHRKPIAVSS